MFIRSERLFLRPAWPEDWQDVLSGIDDEALIRNLARVPWPYTAADAQAFVSRPQERRFPHLLFTLPGSSGARVIGAGGLHADGDDVEIGYWVAREHWGKGYATEAVRTLVCVARALGHRRIVAGHFADNPASGRVLHKAGFRPTGDTRARYSLGRAGEAPGIGYALDLAAIGGSDDESEVQRAA